MSVDERARHELYAKLEETIGHKHADTMTASLLPVTVGELATKADLDGLRLASADLDAFRVATKADIDGLRSEMDQGLAQVRSGFVDLRSECGELRSDFQQHRLETRSDMAHHRVQVGADLQAAVSQMTWRMVVTMLTLVVAVLGIGQIG